MRAQPWLRRIAISVGALLVLIALLAVFAINSTWALRQAVQLGLRAAPVDLKVDQIDGTLAGGVTLLGARLDTDAVSVSLERLCLRIDLGDLISRRVIVHELTLDQVHVTPKPATETTPAPRGPFAVPEITAPLPIQVNRFAVNGLRVSSAPDYPIDQLKTALSWEDSRIRIRKLVVNAPFAGLDLNATADLGTEPALDATINWTWTEPAAKGALTLGGTVGNIAFDHQLSAPASVSSTGQIQLEGRVQPLIDLTHALARPYIANDVRVGRLTLQHRGTPSDTVAALSARVSHPRLPATNVNADVAWHDSTLRVDTVAVDGDALQAQLSGTVATKGGVTAELDVVLARLSAALLDPSVEGQLAARGHVTARPERWQATLPELTGTINGFDLRGTVDARGAGKDIEIQRGDLSLGDNRVEVRGQIAESGTLDLKARLDLPALAQIDTRFGGTLDGTLTVTGTKDAPALDLALDGRDLAAGALNVREVAAEIALEASGALRGTARLADARVDDVDYGSADLMLAGSRDRPEVSFNVTSNAPLAGLTARGAVSAEQKATHWQVGVTEVAIDADVIGRWALEAPFTARAAPGDIQVTPNIWRSGDGAFIELRNAQMQDDTVAIDARIERLPLAIAQIALPTDITLAGTASADVQLEKTNDQWTGNASWAQSDTILSVPVQATTEEIAFDTATVDLVIERGGLQADIDVQGDHGVSITGVVGVSDMTAIAQSPISGQLDLALGELDWLAALAPGLDQLRGAFEARATIGGRADLPEIKGDLSLTNGSVFLTDAGVRVDGIDMTGALDDDFALNGRAQLGGGPLTIEGRVTQPLLATRRVSVSLAGEQLQVINDDQYQVKVSPDITLVFNAADGASIGGRIDVPMANVRIAELPPSVVTASPDIQVAGREPDDAIALPIHGAVTLALGDEVHVFALGLDTDVGGDVNLRLDEGKPPRLDGRLTLENGTFKAYGQDLVIERGNVIYAGPIDNPNIDLRAVRRVQDASGDVTAGVRVTGAAKQPNIELYSEPALSQTDTLSYLLLGRASDDTSGAEGQSLSQAALNLGLSRSAPLTRELAAGLGLDELTVGGDSLDAAELVAGKQINDRLYIRYSYGVFSNLGAILLRYRLSRRLTLEAGSADAQSLDMLYTIEK
ncbi:MAG: translocation/assembly module TamB domain-containing protein [Pseudomonadota bacterium]